MLFFFATFVLLKKLPPENPRKFFFSSERAHIKWIDEPMGIWKTFEDDSSFDFQAARPPSQQLVRSKSQRVTWLLHRKKGCRKGWKGDMFGVFFFDSLKWLKFEKAGI